MVKRSTVINIKKRRLRHMNEDDCCISFICEEDINRKLKKRIFKKKHWSHLKLHIECSYNIHYGDFPSLKSIFRYYYKHPEKGNYIPWILEGAGFKYMNYEYYEPDGKYRVINGGKPILIESYEED